MTNKLDESTWGEVDRKWHAEIKLRMMFYDNSDPEWRRVMDEFDVPDIELARKHVGHDPFAVMRWLVDMRRKNQENKLNPPAEVINLVDLKERAKRERANLERLRTAA